LVQKSRFASCWQTGLVVQVVRDPGSSQFMFLLKITWCVCLVLKSSQSNGLRMGLEGEVIPAFYVTKSIERAQKKWKKKTTLCS
jgi:hypothetical protein